MKRKGHLLAIIIITAIIIFIIYSTWLISRPKPVEVQGEVEATQVKVSSKLIGRIDTLAVHKGNYVKKGQLLFRLSSPEIEARLLQAQAALKGAQAQNSKATAGAQSEDIQTALNTYLKAQAAFDFAEKTFQRVNNLFKEGVVPAQKRDEAETQAKAALETANAARAIWEKAKKGTRPEDKEAASAMVARAQGAINEVEAYLNESSIYSPIDGEVSNIIAEAGELVSAGYPVITLIRPDDNWVTFNLREDLLSSIRMGSVFQASFPALAGQSFDLKVTYINPLGNFATWNATKTSGDFDMKTFEVHAVPIKHVEGLRPGMSAIVNWKTVSEKHAR